MDNLESFCTTLYLFWILFSIKPFWHLSFLSSLFFQPCIVFALSRVEAGLLVHYHIDPLSENWFVVFFFFFFPSCACVVFFWAIINWNILDFKQSWYGILCFTIISSFLLHGFGIQLASKASTNLQLEKVKTQRTLFIFYWHIRYRKIH